MVTGFELVRTRGPAGVLHHRALPEPLVPTIWWHDVTRPALILGSTLDASIVDAAACQAAGIDVVRRRSGGGAVLLVPEEYIWLDVILPAGEPGWSDDVHRPMVWLGRHLARVMASVSAEVDSSPGSAVRGAAFEVHDGALVATAWSRIVCFDGVGPGEVLRGGAKLVGISQRRTREAARLQVLWHSSYDPAALPALFRPECRPAIGELNGVAVMDRSVAAMIPERLASALDRLAPA